MAVFSRFPFCLKRAAPAITRFNHQHQEQLVDVYGMTINTIQTGEGSRGLLLLPGAIGSAWTDFQKQIEQLPSLLPDYKIIGWDPPGCGKSSAHPRNVFTDLFVDDANTAVDLMQALNIGFFSVLGWGAGGTTALVMAGRFPQFIDKVGVWGASAYFSNSELKKLDEYRECAAGKNNKPLEQLYGQERYTQMWQTYVDEVSKLINARDGDFCKTEVDCIEAPTLILHGAKDPVISKEHVDYLQQHIKQSEYYEFENGGHDIHIQDDKLFNTTVSKFLLEKNK